MAYTQWTAGTRITASKLAGITPKFADWTPDWTAGAGTDPDFGNATVNCRYAQSGDLVVAYFEVTFGSTTVFGSAGGNWRFTLPVTSGMSGTPYLGTFEVNAATSAGGPNKMVGKARQSLTTTFALELESGQVDGSAATATGELDHATPETWISGDTLKGTLMYEAA